MWILWADYKDRRHLRVRSTLKSLIRVCLMNPKSKADFETKQDLLLKLTESRIWDDIFKKPVPENYLSKTEIEKLYSGTALEKTN